MPLERQKIRQEPNLLFNSLPFLFVFLPIAFFGYAASARIRGDLRLFWLLACSLAFYANWEPWNAPILIASIGFNFLAGRCVAAAENRQKSMILAIGIFGNLALLGYFKYAGFLAFNLNEWFGAGVPVLAAALPIGISFFTFQQIAFLIDCRNGLIEEKSLLRYACMISFFPHLIAGPIVHPKEFLPQVAAPGAPKLGEVSAGLTLLIIGLCKKVLVADTLAVQSDMVFGAAASGASPAALDAWTGLLCFSLQIYFDFSGYSDMAVGLARMFSFDFPINFSSPYKAASISDFWQRWHVSLSRFLRHYLYIPLGGNRRGPLRSNFNLMATMLLGGLWHGASWNFVIWGALHGLYLGAHRIWSHQQISARMGRFAWWPLTSTALTFAAVMLAWVPFRSADLDSSIRFWSGLLGFNGLMGAAGWHAGSSILTAAALLPFVFFAPNSNEFMARSHVGLPTAGYPATFISPQKLQWRASPAFALVFAFLALLVLLKVNDVSKFLYFQF